MLIYYRIIFYTYFIDFVSVFYTDQHKNDISDLSIIFKKLHINPKIPVIRRSRYLQRTANFKVTDTHVFAICNFGYSLDILVFRLFFLSPLQPSGLPGCAPESDGAQIEPECRRY